MTALQQLLHPDVGAIAGRNSHLHPVQCFWVLDDLWTPQGGWSKGSYLPFKKKLFELFFGILRGQKMSQHLWCLLFLFEFDVIFVLERIWSGISWKHFQQCCVGELPGSYSSWSSGSNLRRQLWICVCRI